MREVTAHIWRCCVILICALAPRSFAGACDTAALPAEIKETLQRQFASWSVVTPELLSLDDRQIWNANYSSECPGIIRGHFTGTRTGYAISLIRGNGKTLEQQIVFFKPSPGRFAVLILDPPSHVAVVSVIRKFAPGVYKTPGTRQSVSVAFDTVGVSEMEAGTIVYYWNGKKFSQVETSI